MNWRSGLLSCALSFALVLSTTPNVQAANSPMDLNSDGSLDVLDVLTLLYCLYFPLSHLTGSMSGHNPGIGLDEATPLVPAWMLIYGTIFPVGFLPIFVIRDKALMRATALAYAWTLCIAFVVFLVFPVQMVRLQGG